MFGMHVELSNPCTSAAFSFSFREPARLGPAASTRTGPADGQRIGVNACHSWGENLVLKTSVMFGMHVELSNPCTSAAFSFSLR